VVRGYFAYHAVPTNTRALSAFRHHVVDIWRRALRRRSQKDRTTWAMVDKLADRWLPKPRISHPWPAQRFRVKHPRWEPYAGMPHVRFCAGCALKAHGTMSPGMATAVKPSRQPRTESCVVSGNGPCEA
jgi:RNA-directed DNA polymerase